MVVHAERKAREANSSGEEVELEEAVILVGRARPEVAGVGQGTPATVEAIGIAGVSEGGRRGSGSVGLTEPDRFGPG